MNEWLLIACMTAVTFATRYPVLALLGRLPLPPMLFRALRFVPVAVLTAISVPAALAPAGTLALTLTNPYLWGSVAAVLVSWRTRNLLATIVAGMAVFALARWL